MCLKEILPYCLAHDIEPFVILRSDGDFREYLEKIGVRYEIIKYHDWLRPKKDHGGFKNELKWRIKSIQNVLAEKKVCKILKRERPDIYHLNVIYNPCGAKSAHKLGIPVVWHLREFAEIDEYTPFFRNKTAAYNLIARSDKIVCVSDCIMEYYSQFMPSEKMVCIYDGIVMPKVAVQKKQPHKPYNITLSGGAMVKGHSDLIKAAKIMTDEGHDDFHIRIAGRFADGKYLDSLKVLVGELGLSDKIEWMGFVKDMDSLWDITDIAVVCSRFESFGLSVCEAMARAIPVVCAESTGTYEVTNKGQYAEMYEVGNERQLAEKLVKTMECYEAGAEKAVEIAGEVREKYSIEKSCKELAEVFKDTALQ